MNKLTDYIHTNTIGLRDYLWRAYLIILGLGIIAAIAGVYRLTSEDKIYQGLHSDVVSQAIGEVGSLFVDGEMVTISGDTLTAIPNQIDLYREDGGYVGIDTTSTCVEFFDTMRQGLLATSDAICLRDDNEQQMVTRHQINQGRAEIDESTLVGLEGYPTLMSLLIADPLTIDELFFQSLETELQTLTTDSTVAESLHDMIQLIRRPIILGVVIGWMMISIVVTLVMIMLPLIFLTLVSRAMMAISGHTTTFHDEFRRTWLPGTLILVLTRLIPGIGFWVGAVVRLIFPLSHITQLSKDTSSSS